MKTIGIFNPYWDSLGGGERYTLFFALSALRNGYAVEIFWHDMNLLTALEKRYGVSTEGLKVNIKGWQTLTQGMGWSKRRLLKQLESVFWVSDGSRPWLWTKKNYIHFQVPFKNLPLTLLDRIKISGYTAAIVNSQFTQTVIKEWYPGNTFLVYPPAHTFRVLKKENLILSVGRFDQTMQAKRQDVLIDAFKDLTMPGYRLVLAGGVLHGVDEVKRLREKAKGSAVEIITNPSFEKLSELYGRAKIYWHAAGYSAEGNVEPDKVEHFGITTVEAMSAGAVPLAYEAGGQKEIITHGDNGFLWKSTKELLDLTEKLLSHQDLYDRLAYKACNTHTRFNEEAFFHATAKLLS